MKQIKVSIVWDRRDDGKGLVEVKVYFPGEKRESSYFSTKQFVEPRMWDYPKALVNSEHPEQEKVQGKIDLVKGLAQKAVNHCLDVYGPFPDKSLIRKSFFNMITERENGVDHDFISFIRAELKASNELASSTKLIHRETLKRLVEYAQEETGGKLSYKKVNYTFAIEFDRYLRTRYSNLNTINKHYRVIKRYVNQANKRGYIDYDTYTNYSLFTPGKQDTNKEVLMPDELRALEKCKGLDRGSNEWIVWKMFLFGCYTGLRISDLVKLNEENIHFNSNEEYILVVSLEKLKRFNRQVRLPLQFLFDSKPLKIIKEMKELKKDLGDEDKLIFKFFNNFNANYHLKKVIEKVDIKKNVTFHVARYTFCTFLAHKTGSLFTVMEYGGITSVPTAQGYIHLAEQLLKDQLRDIEWD